MKLLWRIIVLIILKNSFLMSLRCNNVLQMTTETHNGQVFVCTNKFCRDKGSDATMATFNALAPLVNSISIIFNSFLLQLLSKINLLTFMDRIFLSKVSIA